jgi:hypothetical protein
MVDTMEFNLNNYISITLISILVLVAYPCTRSFVLFADGNEMSRRNSPNIVIRQDHEECLSWELHRPFPM